MYNILIVADSVWVDQVCTSSLHHVMGTVSVQGPLAGEPACRLLVCTCSGHDHVQQNLVLDPRDLRCKCGSLCEQVTPWPCVQAAPMAPAHSDTVTHCHHPQCHLICCWPDTVCSRPESCERVQPPPVSPCSRPHPPGPGGEATIPLTHHPKPCNWPFKCTVFSCTL